MYKGINTVKHKKMSVLQPARRTTVVQKAVDNNLQSMYNTKYKYMMLLLPNLSMKVVTEGKMVEVVAPISTDFYSTWTCFFTETYKEVEEFAKEHSFYDFLVMDISKAKIQKLKMTRKKVVTTVEVDEIDETVEGGELEDIEGVP